MKLTLTTLLAALFCLSAGASKWPSASIYNLNSSWQNQNGEKVALQDLAGSPRLVAMLYTRCTTTCPLVLEDFKAILKDLPDETAQRIRLTIFSIDSERETAASLKDFAKKKKLDDRWQLLTSGASEVSSLAAALGVRYKKIGTEYTHSNSIFLWDETGQVAAQKDGLRTPRGDFVSKIKSALR